MTYKEHDEIASIMIWASIILSWLVFGPYLLGYLGLDAGLSVIATAMVLPLTALIWAIYYKLK